MFDFVPIQLYVPIYYWLMTALCICTGFYYFSSESCQKLLVQNSCFGAVVFTFLLTLYFGLRPISGKYFVDMFWYDFAFKLCNTDGFEGVFDIQKEWLWEFIMRACKIAFNDAHVWFLVIAIMYFGFHIWACKKLLKENVWMAVLFVFFSFQFFNFGVNGMRNGTACAIMMLSIAFFADQNKKGYFGGIVLLFLALGCHRSVIIPFAALLASLFVIKKTKTAIYTWLICIILSLFTGNFFLNLFASIGFDDRMNQYSTLQAAHFSRMGFRWDFLLYSAMPVWMAWYISKKKINDEKFRVLANTYILANAFWVLVCRVAYSNRFAYLSWFLYALVLAYAVIRVPIWKDQDRKAGLILIAHTAFTMGMRLISS